jgi:uncharacterized membrane protein
MRNRTWAVLLALSVALNVFFIGVLAARAWARHTWREHGEHAAAAGWHRPGHPGRGSALSWLSESDRAALRPERKALQGLRRQAADELRADNFDAHKLEATLDALRAQTNQLQASMQTLLMQHAATLSPAERRHLADTWGGPDHGPGDHGGPDHDSSVDHGGTGDRAP